MLADGVEAASRTLEQPAPQRLGEVIERITNAIVLDSQLDDCEMTFADLHRIKEAFLRTLVSFHHQRIDYPGFEFKRNKVDSKSGSRRGSAGKAADAGNGPRAVVGGGSDRSA